MRTLGSARCILEPQVAAHAQEMFGVLSDPAIYEFENRPPVDVEWLTQRYERLESRRSEDGSQHWLNWVVRLPDGRLAGFVQATVLPDLTACIAYVLNSRYWRQGIGSSAVGTMLLDLRQQYAVTMAVAILKANNHRSEGLLRKSGFVGACEEQAARYRDRPDELVLIQQHAHHGHAAQFV